MSGIENETGKSGINEETRVSQGENVGQTAVETSPVSADGDDAGAARRRVLIGSQRDPAAYKARHKRDWVPIVGSEEKNTATQSPAPQAISPKVEPAEDVIPAGPLPGSAAAEALDAAEEAMRNTAAIVAASASLTGREQSTAEEYPAGRSKAMPGPVADATVPPSRRQRLTADMEAEFNQALGDVSFDELMSGGESVSRQELIEPESKHHAKVVAIRRDQVFVELGGREQGTLPLTAFAAPPEAGSMVEIIVQKFNAEEGLYDLSLPGTSIELGNWDDVQNGMTVDAIVTGHNTGGLECEVNHLRGFIPISQVALYRINDLSPYVGQKLPCIITEANRSRKNLVLSHRAVLEREKEENRQKFMEALQPGQIYDGTVRKLMDFGAFVELGNGTDGLLHVSQLSWGRVSHPSEVLQEGQPIKVRIEKIDRATGRIGLSYRDMLENPWSQAKAKYAPQTVVHGKVSKLMEFGAFVELEPGIEGLIHISELAHKRVYRAKDVVQEGQEVDVLVLSTDVEAQRISLSLKAMTKQEPTKKEKEEAAEPELPAPSKEQKKAGNQPLRGGLTNKGDGEKFGLKW